MDSSTSQALPAGAVARQRIACIEHTGRFLLASLFLLAGINKLLNFTPTLLRMQETGIPLSEIALPLTIALELIGGALLAWGRWGAWQAAAALALFTLATNALFHRFWQMPAETAPLELSLFFKNVAIAGALIMVSAQTWQRNRL
jgi:putative oxidoreductase